MTDRRGHRKLRLTSRKHFKPKPKQIHDYTTGEQLQQVKSPGLKISLPIAAHIAAPVTTVNILQDRLRKHGAIPSGI